MKVLIIDDDPGVLKQIVKAVSETTGPDGKPYDITGIADHEEAEKRLDEERFDAVVTDMFMEQDEEGGLSILRKLTGKSPITIVLTAYPSIPNCAASMRAGAWDYLEKNPTDGSSAYDNLLKSLAEGYDFKIKNPYAGHVNPDGIWVQENLSRLAKEYPGEFIAVLDGRVVDHGTDDRSLDDRIEKVFEIARPFIVHLPDIHERVI